MRGMVPFFTCKQDAVLGAVLPQAGIELACPVLEAVALVHNEVVPGNVAQQRHIMATHKKLIRGQEHMARKLAAAHLQQTCCVTETFLRYNLLPIVPTRP